MTCLLVAAVLGGCGGSDESDSATGNAWDIAGLDVIGTADDIAGENRAPINPMENNLGDNGEFAVRWSVVKPAEEYTVELFASLDNSINAADVLFLDIVCGDTNAPCDDDATMTWGCDLNTDYDVDCGAGPVDLSDFDSGTPTDAWVLMRSCNSSGSACDIAGHRVSFE